MKDYMGLVASLPCACCGAEPVEVHHIRAGQGMGQRPKSIYNDGPVIVDADVTID